MILMVQLSVNGESVIPDDLTRVMLKYKTGEPGCITIKKLSDMVNEEKQRLFKLMRNEAVSRKVGSEVQITSQPMSCLRNDDSYEQTPGQDL